MRSSAQSDGHHVPHLDLAVRVVLISFQLVVIIFEIESCGLLGPARRHDATLGVKTLLLLKKTNKCFFTKQSSRVNYYVQ